MNLCDVSDEVGNGERVEGPQGQGLVCSMESDRYIHHLVRAVGTGSLEQRTRSACPLMLVLLLFTIVALDTGCRRNVGLWK